MCFLKETIGDVEIVINEGSKRENDYVILFDGNQFTDKELFAEMSVWNSEKWKTFWEELENNKYINISNNEVTCNFPLSLNEEKKQEILELINDILQKEVAEDLKKILIGVILRCDIDNINYPLPRFNGAIRHIVQILWLYGYIHNIDELKYDEKLSELNDKTPNEIVRAIYEIGYPRNSYEISKEDFRNFYQNLVHYNFSQY